MVAKMTKGSAEDKSANTEMRPIDMARRAEGASAEAAEMAEHIIEKDPRSTREEHLRFLVELIDESNKWAAKLAIGLEDD